LRNGELQTYARPEKLFQITIVVGLVTTEGICYTSVDPDEFSNHYRVEIDWNAILSEEMKQVVFFEHTLLKFRSVYEPG
jgi:hypothetical protein